MTALNVIWSVPPSKVKTLCSKPHSTFCNCKTLKVASSNHQNTTNRVESTPPQEPRTTLECTGTKNSSVVKAHSLHPMSMTLLYQSDSTLLFSQPCLTLMCCLPDTSKPNLASFHTPREALMVPEGWSLTLISSNMLKGFWYFHNLGPGTKDKD
jgi:hypothetical protein